MISPHTPPGTPLVVVWVSRSLDDVLSVVHPDWHDRLMEILSDVNDPFVIGERVTLSAIVEVESAVGGFLARIHQYKGLFALKCFDIAALPSTLTSILDRVPSDELEDA